MSVETGGSRLRRIVLPVLIIGLAVLGAQVLIASRPDAPKAPKGSQPTFVEVITVKARDERAVITAYGAVQAHRQLTVQPEVGGRVVRLHPRVVVGGTLAAGAELMRIDPRDYQVVVDERRAALAKAEFALQVERGMQVVAKREWSLLRPADGEVNALSRQLALRRPHLQDKLLGLAAAKSRLRKARLDVQRTIIHAPFNALVLRESVETGQLVTPQSSVATLVGTDEFRVQVSVPRHRLDWVTFPGDDTEGAHVRVMRDIGDGTPVVRQGAVVELLGDVTRNGRMAQVMVAVRDPLELTRPADARRPLLLGEYVRVDIDGPLLRGVTALPRHAIREENRVWIHTADHRLEIRPVTIVLSRHNTVLISRGLRDGDMVITSQIPAAIPGLPVRTIDDTDTPSATTDDDGATMTRRGDDATAPTAAPPDNVSPSTAAAANDGAPMTRRGDAATAPATASSP